ncbi:hypothetical protein DFJ43DRAFT_405485 [Lentinula guzmanii]|uniref:Uncharacterized protein n=1 Tax=Lentinula guzmanii TaxID=2804957 RepID=A0AA38N5E5_9AGAR|nr:hypothetical protein DFJ43DRAFT_405485 [Lentinula guzmanii]
MFLFFVLTFSIWHLDFSNRHSMQTSGDMESWIWRSSFSPERKDFDCSFCNAFFSATHPFHQTIYNISIVLINMIVFSPLLCALIIE